MLDRGKRRPTGQKRTEAATSRPACRCCQHQTRATWPEGEHGVGVGSQHTMPTRTATEDPRRRQRDTLSVRSTRPHERLAQRRLDPATAVVHDSISCRRYPCPEEGHTLNTTAFNKFIARACRFLLVAGFYTGRRSTIQAKGGCCASWWAVELALAGAMLTAT